MKLALSLLTLVLVTTPAGANNDRLKMYLSIGAAMAPANVYVQTVVERSTSNRSIRVVADSETFYSSSSVSLDGDRAPRINTVKFAQVPPGHYTVMVSVLGIDGRELAQARQWFDIR